MAISNKPVETLYAAKKLLAKYRCGFDICKVGYEYLPLKDERIFYAVGNITLIYNLGYEPDYDKMIESLIPKWDDPIC